MRFVVLLAVFFWFMFSGAVWALDVEKVRKMTDVEIEERITKGEFLPSKNRGFVERNRQMVCEWVEADRRVIVTKILQSNFQSGKIPISDSRYPLLACSPTEEAYRYWQSMGASIGKLGKELPLKAVDATHIAKWGYDFDDRHASLAVAAGNLNAMAVALLLTDGAQVNERSGSGVHTPLGTALLSWRWIVLPDCLACTNWTVAGEKIFEREGYMPGPDAADTTYTGHGGDLRRRNSDLSAAIQVVRLLMEAGASLDDLSGQGYMAAKTLSYRGYRIPGQTYRQKFANKDMLGVTLPKLLEAEAYAKEIRGYMAGCKSWNENECKQILAKADEISPTRQFARQQMAILQKTQADWAALIAAQTCTLTIKDWAYSSGACANGRANGQGKAVRWWSGEIFEGEFRDGAFADGKYSRHDGQTIFQGRFNPDGSYASGKQFESGHPVYEGSFSETGKRHGSGICWVDGAPEECRHHDGQRIDSLHKQRLENEKLKKELGEQQKQKEAAALRQAQEDYRRRKEQEDEDRKDARFQSALAAGIGAMRGDYSAAAAAGMPGADTVVMQQKMNVLNSQLMAAQGRSPSGTSTSPATSLVTSPVHASPVPLPVQVPEKMPGDVDALAKKKLTRFRCEWTTVTQPEGEEMIAEGPCHAADMASHEIQCRPDWQSHPATLRLYQCAAQHSTGLFKQRYEERARAYEEYQRKNIR